MMRWSLLTLILAILLVACGPETGPVAQPAPTETAALTQAPAEPTAASADAAIATPPPEVTAAPPASPPPAPTDSPAEAEEPAPQVEPTQVAEYGPFEGTYFRGRADAPILMYDYSDFL